MCFDYLYILGLTQNEDLANYIIGSFMMPIGLFFGVFGLTQGFKPEITKQIAKTIHYNCNNNI